jgi:two-component system, chemotaxis family, chemotaxis protein CheY
MTDEAHMSKKVLIVDDSSIVRMQVGRLLTDEGFIVVEAIDGVDATEKLAASPDAKLIICDITMPRMSGLEFLSTIRQNGSPPVPIVMLTTEGRPEMIQKAKALGAKGWLVKPFKPDHLLSVVKKLTSAV